MIRKNTHKHTLFRRLLSVRLFVLWLSVATLGCGNSDVNDNDIYRQLLTTVEILNRETEEVLVDNFTRTITIRWYEGQDKEDTRIRFTLAEGVSMVSPSQPESVVDLHTFSSVVLSTNGRQVVYQVSIQDVTKPINEDELFEGWTAISSFGELPDGIKVYRSPDQLKDKNAVAYIAVADISKGRNFHALGEAQGYQTLSGFYESSDQAFPVIINAGYFWDGWSLSMILRNGELISPNGQTVTRSNGSGNVPFYPTRGVFGQLPNGEFRTDWVFTTVTPGTTYAYPAPSPNKTGTAPQPVPSAAFPANGWEYQAVRAIGGGPILIKDGEYQNTWEAELYDAASGIGPTSNQPRTAIGITDSGRIILFVCEGRNMTPDVPGFTLQDVAGILQDLGCAEALNLDGGGSTCMLVNGIETIKPSDGRQRNIVSAIGIQ